MRVLAILLLCSPAFGQWQTADPERSAFVTAKPVIQGTATQEPSPVPVVKESVGNFTKATTKESGLSPHLIATVADRGCGPCTRWKDETLPALTKAGWRVQVNVVPFGSQAVPEFRMGNRVLEGYTTRAAFYSWAKPTGPSATGVAVSQPAAAPVVFRRSLPRGWHTYTCDRCGNSWSHGREANGNRAMHTCGNCGAVEWN